MDAEPCLANCGTHHECFEVRTPPLRQTVSNLPLISHAMGRIKLLCIRRGSEAFIQTTFEPVNLILAGLQVVAGPASRIQTTEAHKFLSAPIRTV